MDTSPLTFIHHHHPSIHILYWPVNVDLAQIFIPDSMGLMVLQTTAIYDEDEFNILMDSALILSYSW